MFTSEEQATGARTERSLIVAFLRERARALVDRGLPAAGAALSGAAARIEKGDHHK
jgi:hypothetical protein